MLYTASINGKCSLDQASCEIAESFGISISKQGLDDRYDATAMVFIRSIFEEQLSKQIDGSIDSRYLKDFTRVRIKDSTRFDLPERLKTYFCGYGGKVTSEAAACIQYEFDVKSCKTLDIDFTPARKTDYQDAREKIEDIEKGDLIIRDLGYFNTGVFKKIIDKDAFFISRLHSKILVFDQNEKEIYFSKLYNKMIREKRSHLDTKVFIGNEEKLPVRLIIDIMPEEIYQARIRKAEKEAKKKGYQVSNEFKARARFNLLITNIPQENMSGNHIYKLYKIRWQIELIFKSWKSTCGIDKIHPMKYHRLMCLFYAKFLLILINYQIINLFHRVLYNTYGKLLSKDKCLKTLTNYFYKIRRILVNPHLKTALFLQSIACLLSKNHWLEKRKNRLNYSEIFNLYIS